MLEPEGTVEIKYRQQQIIKTIHRCDPQCGQMANELNKLKDSKDEEKKAELEV